MPRGWIELPGQQPQARAATKYPLGAEPPASKGTKNRVAETNKLLKKMYSFSVKGLFPI